MSHTVSDSFFWGDWANDPGLKLSSLAAQGLWMRMLCICAEANPKGYLLVAGRPLSPTELAHIAGKPEQEVEALLMELDRNGVFSRDAKTRIYSRRMLRDQKKQRIARKNGKAGGNPTLCRGTRIRAPDKGGVKPHIPSPVSVSGEEQDAAFAAPDSVREESDLFRRGKDLLGKNAGGFIKQLLAAKAGNVALARSALETASTKQDPREYLGAVIRGGDRPGQEYGVDYW
jgi:hypothetical protein